MGPTVEAVQAMGWERPSPVQMAAVPIMNARRDGLFASATGSGKTGSFGLGIACVVDASVPHLQAVVLAPTRELSAQTSDVLSSLGLKVAHLKKRGTGCTKGNVLVTTPLTVANAITAGGVDLSHVVCVVLDEADRLLDDQFAQQTDVVLGGCPAQACRLLFSATLRDDVVMAAETFLRDPISVVVGNPHGSTRAVRQELSYVGEERHKIYTLKKLLAGAIAPPVLVFCSTQARVLAVYKAMADVAVPIGFLHGSRTPQQRQKTIDELRRGEIWVLLTTNLLARGIDIPGVSLVVNFDLPPSGIEYTHTVGRTGRQKEGRAVTLFTDEDGPLLRPIATAARLAGSDVPAWMFNISTMGRRKRKEVSQHHRVRDTLPGEDALMASRKAGTKRPFHASHSHSVIMPISNEALAEGEVPPAKRKAKKGKGKGKKKKAKKAE
ncbi:hypothetical protein KIPB_011229 [Kipferlia bialata]|uniref:RNA helicase n=1 Tax=Kipferlia bialata TaxID=797122 RepID=A0A9K3D5T0_9EUKA|nr:hypothetical protein KIPB_011229 [Kipferlia bialata]|eukprot:g11229.t1